MIFVNIKVLFLDKHFPIKLNLLHLLIFYDKLYIYGSSQVFRMDDLTGLEKRVLEQLLEDSRKSYRQIAQSVGVSTTTTINKVNGLVKKGIIRDFTTNINWERLGFNYSLCISVQVDGCSDHDLIGARIAEMNNIFQVFNITGDADFSIHAKCRNNQEASKLLEKIRGIEGILRVTPHVVLKTYKDDAKRHRLLDSM